MSCKKHTKTTHFTYLDLVPPVLSRTLGNELSPSGTIVGSISRVTPVNTQYVQIFFQCLAMSSLVFQPSSCHLLVSILRPNWLVWLLGVAECDQQIVFFWLLLCRVVPFVQIMPSLRHSWCGRAMRRPICSRGIDDEKHQSSCWFC